MTKQFKKGFTIIEVVLVLAIAGLILVMAIIALPALQRSQRDTARKQDLARLQGAINNYSANNRGRLPTLGTDYATFIKKYLLTSGGDDFVDPKGLPAEGNDGYMKATDEDPEHYVMMAASDIDMNKSEAADFEKARNVIYYRKGAKCSPDEGKFIDNQGNRKIAFMMKLEGGGFTCLSN